MSTLYFRWMSCHCVRTYTFFYLDCDDKKSTSALKQNVHVLSLVTKAQLEVFKLCTVFLNVQHYFAINCMQLLLFLTVRTGLYTEDHCLVHILIDQEQTVPLPPSPSRPVRHYRRRCAVGPPSGASRVCLLSLTFWLSLYSPFTTAVVRSWQDSGKQLDQSHLNPCTSGISMLTHAKDSNCKKSILHHLIGQLLYFFWDQAKLRQHLQSWTLSRPHKFLFCKHAGFELCDLKIHHLATVDSQHSRVCLPSFVILFRNPSLIG